MDRKSLVASLQSFRKNLVRQQYLNSSLDELRRKRDEYKRGSRQPLRKECDTAPEKAKAGDTNLAEYDEKNKPRLPKGMDKEDGEDPTLLNCNLIYTVLIISTVALAVVLMFVCRKILPSFKIFENWISTIVVGILLLIASLFVLLVVIVFLVTLFIDPVIRSKYLKRKKEYYIKHKQARTEAYQKDLDEKYASGKKYADEMAQKLPKAELAVANASREFDAVNKAVAEYDILPEKYKTLDAVEHISDYIRDMRADSIKEAINLYAYEASERSHRNRLMWEAQLQTEAMQNAADAAWRAADEQARTARAQERAADEAEKRRKAAEETIDKVKDIKDILDS